MGRSITVNFNGLATDPEATARAIADTVAGSQRRNAMARTPEPAW
jgi:hypothetical protein